MLLIRCPFCEEARPEIEFRYAGEAHIARPAEPASVSDAEWAAYLYVRGNPKGWHRERWMHAAGCRRWFNAIRSTTSHEIAATDRVGEKPPLPGEPARKGA